MSKIYKTQGIILRNLSYSETSIILDIYSREIGLASYIVSGVRKSKSKIANVFHPMNIIELVAYRNDSKLSRIKEAGLHIRYQSLNVDVIKSTLGVFYIDLIRSSIKEKEKNESLYDHISETLQDLDRSELDLAQKPLVYSIALASYLGFELSDNYTEVNRYFDLTSGQFIDNDLRHKHIINEDISLAIHQLLRGQVVTSKERRTEVLDALMAYYRFHIEGFKTLKSLKVLRTLLS